MNLTRLMALGILARSGPSHGHHIRRIADLTNVGEWGGVSVGALYRELRSMEREGLVEAARTEKVGNRPERTVYAITAEGQLELMTLREQAVRPLGPGADPLGVALLFAGEEMEPRELRRALRARRDMMAVAIEQVAAEREQLMARGVLNVLAAAVMRRKIMSVEAEIRWHDELDAALAEASGDAPDRIGGGSASAPGGGSSEVTPPRQAAFAITAEKPGGEPHGRGRPSGAGLTGAGSDGLPVVGPAAEEPIRSERGGAGQDRNNSR